MTNTTASFPADRSRTIARRPWVDPVLLALPALEQLTLQTAGIIGSCGTGGGGSCSFSLLPTITGDGKLPG